MEDKKMTAKMHTLILEAREKLSITGVLDVESFDEENIILETNMGMIMVRGFNLHINKLSIESSELIIEGEICSVTYHDEGSSKKGSFFKKMFR